MNNLQRLLLTGSTSLLRFWFGLTAIGYAVFLLRVPADHYEYAVTMQVASRYVWVALFILVGCATVYGAVTSKYSKATLVVEGFLGVAVWTAVGISSSISQGSIGAVTIAAVISIYLLIRYPTWQ